MMSDILGEFLSGHDVCGIHHMFVLVLLVYGWAPDNHHIVCKKNACSQPIIHTEGRKED